MATQRGISISDLLGWAPPGAQALLPDDVAGFLERLAVLDYHSMTSDESFIHFGTVQADSIKLPRITGSTKPAEAPELTRGVYFRLLFPRVSRGAGQNVEPAPNRFVLDLVFDPVSFEMNGLTPALHAPASGTTPAHLEPAIKVRRPSDKPRTTRLFARGAFRVVMAPGGTVDVAFVDFPDPFDADLSSGPVFDAWFEPQHFFIKSVGMSVGDVALDFSSSVTPPKVTARGQGPEWQGIAIDEAMVYLPKAVTKLGLVNFGIRDFLIGHPIGLQGEAYFELGQDPATTTSPAAGPLRLTARTDAGPTQLTPVPNGNVDVSRLFFVPLPGDGTTTVRAQLDAPPPNTQARWTLPARGGLRSRAEGFFTPEFQARPGDSLIFELTRVDTIDGKSQSVTFDSRHLHFMGTAGATATSSPHKINVEVPENATPFENVTSLSGSVSALEGITLVASQAGEGLQWVSILGNVIVSGQRHELTGLNKNVDIGAHLIKLRDSDNRTRHIIIQIVEKGGLVVGCQAGIFDKDGNLVEADTLKSQHDLSIFHKDARFVDADGEFALNDGVPTVAEGILAELMLKNAPGDEDDDDDDDDDDSNNTNEKDTERLQILVDYDLPESDDDPLSTALPRWGDKSANSDGRVDTGYDAYQNDTYLDPPTIDYGSLESGLKEWAKKRVEADSEAEFLVVGRCDDIRDSTNLHNKGLAQRRANAVARIIETVAPQPAKVHARGEQDKPKDLESGNDPDNKKVREALYGADRDIISAVPKFANENAEKRLTALENNATDTVVKPASRLINLLFRKADPQTLAAKWLSPRAWYRRIDIVVLSKPPPKSDRPSTNENELGQDPKLNKRRIWVPGADGTKSTKPVVPESKYPMLVQACIGWDSPKIADAFDLFPNKLEASLTWVHRGVKIPGETTPVDLTTCKENPTIPEFYKLTARFTHDQRTEETVYTLGLDSIGDPNGLACVAQKELASTMALAPGLLPLLDGDGIDDDGAKLAAMLAIIAFANFVAEDGKIVIEGVEAELRSRGYIQLEGLRLRLSVDYAVEVSWDLKIIKGTKVKLRYRNVGVMIDVSALQDPGSLDLDDIRFVFDEVSVEVQNPGEWSMTNDTLSRLLRVTAARVGTGSAWIEVDLGLALDLGVISITQATVRAALTSDGLDVDLRGLEVHLDVPGTLKGRGKLAIDPQGGLTSAIDLQVIPAGVSAAARLKLLGNFFALFVDTRFSTAIPLASTGLGIYGFNGHLVVNGSRALPAGDVISREIAWYALEPTLRYQPDPGTWSIGLGTVIGTLPDEGFTFNAKGNLAIEVPDLSVVFGVDGQFLKKPGPATTKGQPPPENAETLRILGLVAVDDEAVTIGMRGLYQYRRLLKLEVPVGAHFPIGSADPYFVRVGSDGFPGNPPGVGARPGHPVSVSILPGSLDLDATAFFMVEEKGLQQLGNKPGFNFPGFAIGTGVKFDLDFGNNFIGVEVLAEFLAGIGFSPLTIGAGIFIKGEVFFLLLSAGIEGELVLRYVDDPDKGELLSIFGKLCARVGFWKFKKKKCGDVEIGDALESPTPPSPIAGVDFINRLDRVVASSALGIDEPPTVWPDTIPVVHFSHSADIALGAGSSFTPEQIEGPTWVGSDDVQFAYRITDIEIRRVGGPAVSGPLPSAWVFPSHRGKYPGDQDPPTGDEKRDLHLLSDHPFRWARNIIDGGATLAADPVGSLDRICEPTPEPTPVCAFGELAQRMNPSLLRLRPHGPSSGPFPSYFDLVVSQNIGGISLQQATLFLAEQGLQVQFGQVVPIPPPVPSGIVTGGATSFFNGAYIEDRGQLLVTVPMECKFEPDVVEPEIVLALCRPGTVQQDPGIQCATYEDLKTDFVAQTLNHKRLRYEAIHGAQTGFFFLSDAGGQRSIRYIDQGMRVILPEPATEVIVTIFQKSLTGDDVQPPQRLKIEAFASSGQQLATKTDHRNIFDRNRVLRIKDNSNRGITRIVLSGGSGRSHLVRFCYRTRLNADVQDLVDEANQAGQLPVVRGTRTNGAPVNWIPTVFPSPQTGIARPPCVFVSYKPPFDSEWTGVRVGAWRQSHVGVVRACAITSEAKRQRDEAEDARQDAIDDWNIPPVPPRVLLDADTDYEVVVKWRADAWARPLENGKPSQTETRPPANPSFTHTGTDAFAFRTAVELPTLDDDTPFDEEDETEFEPRRVRKYVKRLLPDHESAPHFTEDPARVAYSVGYVKDLLAKYGRDLVVRVVRTDPPPGSQPPEDEGPGGTTGPGSFAIGDLAIEFPDELLEAVDVRVNNAVVENNCLNPRPPEGEARELFFDHDPLAEYDLQIVAPKNAGNEQDPPIIQKTHFRTSRFTGPRELLDRFDFTEDAPGVSLPVEMLIDGTMPTDILNGDEDFDSTLLDLGLDPLALATGARLAILLQQDEDRLELAGILMEAPEPIVRPGRLRVLDATVTHIDGTPVLLELVRVNDSGSRLLFAATVPSEFGDGSATMEIRLSGTREGVIKGVRFLTAGLPALAEAMEP